jgi:UDP-glucose 4-epimerase
MPTNESILVTGAAGFIGSHTCEELVNAGYSVVGIDNLRTGKLENLDAIIDHPRFSFMPVDCRSYTMEYFFEGYLFETFHISRILHLAALVSVPESFEKPGLNFEFNVKAVNNVALLCGKHKLKKLVFSSSASVYGDPDNNPNPLSPYAVSKLASETLIKGYASCYGFSQTCLRYFNVYGPRQDPSSSYSGVISIFSDKYKKGEGVTVYGDGEQTRDFIHVKDVARANRLALMSDENEEGNIDVCTGRSLTLNYLLSLLHHKYPRNPLPVYAEAREGDIKHSCGNHKMAANRLGFRSGVTFEEGIAELI